jgi:hypothetical protein
MIHCTADTNATPVSVQGVGINFYVDLNFASPQRCETCTQPPIQWEPGALSVVVKWPVREADHSTLSSAEFKECVGLYLHSLNTPSFCDEVKAQGQL